MKNRGDDRRRSPKPSRAMISGELSWAFMALLLAWSGSGLLGMEGSFLNRALVARGEFVIAYWSVLIGVPALALVFCSGREYLLSKRERWSMEQLLRSSRTRFWCCVALAFSWLYMLNVIWGFGTRTSALRGIALGGLLFTMWFVWENGRVRRECEKAMKGAADDQQPVPS